MAVPRWMELMEFMEHVVKWLSVYVYRIVPLVSLSMHLILAAFSESRRREYHGWKRLLVWVAYQLTDWGPAYVIGNLYLETSPPEKMIIAFWVPFLLLHHARPDNISAYTIEDSELWIRLVVSVIPQSAGSFFIVWRFILTDCAAEKWLRWASGIMLFLGIWRYLENAAALMISNLGRIHDQKWLSEKQIDLLSLKSLSENQTGPWDKRNDDEALLVAHDLFEICEGAFCDYTVGVNHKAMTTMFSGKWESMCTVVEMELSLMYDILYTKAAVVHTWHGYVIRLASPLFTAAALVLFVLQDLHCKEGMKPVDEAISYILLSTTFLLDVRWLFRALASSWTHSYIKHMPCGWLKHEFLCQERWRKLRGFVVSLCLSQLSLRLWAGKETKSYRRWGGTFGQCNLLGQCTAAGNRHNLYSIPGQLAIESGDHLWSRGLESEDHSRGREIPDYVKELVFGKICGILFPRPVGSTNPDQTTDTSTPGPPDSPEYPRGTVSPGSKGSSTGPTDPDSPGSIVISRPGPSTGTNQPTRCTCVHPVSPDPDDPCLGPPCPRERICNGIQDEPPLCVYYPRGWTCTGVDVQTDPGPQYPRQQICIGINNETPRLLPCPCCQVPAGTRNALFQEENGYMPYGHPEEQAAEYHWRHDYYEQTEHSEYRRDTPNIYVQDDGQAKAGTVEQHGGQTKPMESDKGMEFPPELQEVILIWHIATDVFLSCRPGITRGDNSTELEKAIEQMSDYMVFLVTKRSEMLPGLKLGSRYKNTQRALRKIRDMKAASEGRKQYYTSYVRTNEKEELAKWMPENMDRLKGLDTDIIWEGTQLARVLLSRVPKDVQPKWIVTDEEVVGTVKKLDCWALNLKDRRTFKSMEAVLEFILDVWVSLLLYASIRCSRDSHAKQLSRGGELTTLVWVITEHAETIFVKEHLPLFFPPKKQERSRDAFLLTS